MKHFKLINLFAFWLTIGLISSCSKNESTPVTPASDVRDVAIGSYSGIQTITDTSDSTTIDTIVFTISKGAGNSLNITEDGVTISTSPVLNVGKDLSGNIPLQTITADGFSFKIQGAGNNNEHFGFLESAKVFTYDFQVNDGPITGYKVTVFGSKK